MNDLKYLGKELSIFSQARSWKSYWASRISPYLGKSILEVGAGIGSNTRILFNERFDHWVCLEPDPELADNLLSNIQKFSDSLKCNVINGTIKDIPPGTFFDTILYLDVLEHIKDDKAEIDNALNFLEGKGKIIVLAPSHSWLFSEFDKSIGHYRRYNKRLLTGLVSNNLELLSIEYLDSVGLLISLGNRYILRSPIPSKNQIKTWDSLIIPCSRLLDKVFGYRLGKSILAVWMYDP